MHKSDPRLHAVGDDAIIWRYINFISFYSLFLNKSLFFKRLDKYTDAFEGSLPEQTKEKLLKYRLNFADTTPKKANEWVISELTNIESYEAHTLSNSWTIGERESYTMWKIYLAGHHEGVAIKTTVSRLKKCLDDNTEFEIYKGKVNYQPIEYNDINVFSVSSNKRETYTSENEYRALIFRQFTLQESGGKKLKVPKFEIGTDVRISLTDVSVIN